MQPKGWQEQLPFERSAPLADRRIWIGEHPCARGEDQAAARLARLGDVGITCIVDLTGPREMPSYEAVVARVSTAERRFEAVRVHVPEVPRETLSEGVREAIVRVDALLRDGHTVYIHAKGIGGRLSTFVGCLLAQSGYTGDEAHAETRRLWDTVARGSSKSVTPSSGYVEEIVRGWERGNVMRLLAREPQLIRYQRDRARGALLGLAVGDVLGAEHIRGRRGEIALPGGKFFRLQAGEWTAPTAMALCLTENVFERCANTRDLLSRYIRWRRSGYRSSHGRAVGVSDALRRAEQRLRTGQKQSVGQDGWCGDDQDLDAGSIAQLAPIAHLRHQTDPAIKVALYSMAATHASPLVKSAGYYLITLLYDAIRGVSKRELLDPERALPGEGWWPNAMPAAELRRLISHSTPHSGEATVLVALRNAIRAFRDTRSFRDGLAEARSMEPLARYTTTIYGQLAGAFYGESAIPVEWTRNLARLRLLDRYAECLFQASLCPEYFVDTGSLTRPPSPRVAWEMYTAMPGPEDHAGAARRLTTKLPVDPIGARATLLMEAVSRIRVELGLALCAERASTASEPLPGAAEAISTCAPLPGN